MFDQSDQDETYTRRGDSAPGVLRAGAGDNFENRDNRSRRGCDSLVLIGRPIVVIQCTALSKPEPLVDTQAHA
jgi:hypothetical protein